MTRCAETGRVPPASGVIVNAVELPAGFRVKRPTKREKSLCQKIQYLCDFHTFLTKGLNCEKWAY